MFREPAVTQRMYLAVCLMVSAPCWAGEQHRDCGEEAAIPMDQPVVARQANLDLIVKGTVDAPLLTVVFRNTGGVPLTVDSELVFGVTVEVWGARDERITPEHDPVPKTTSQSVDDVKKRLTTLPPGGTISRSIDLRRGWKVLGAAIGVSREGGPLLGGYEKIARLPAGTRVRKIIVTYGDYGDFWRAFVGFAGLSPVQAGLFLGPIQQSAEVVAERERGREGGQAASRPSAEEARRALIDMVDRGDKVDLKMSLPNLHTDRVVEVAKGVVDIGQWRCNLMSRTFGVGVFAEPIFAEYTGAFYVTPDGKWRAEITDEKHN